MRATQGTHHRGGDPRSTLGKGNDTTARPRAPEGQPGALQGHHRRPSKARSRASRGAQRSGGTAPPHRRGEDRSRGTRQGGEARVSAASEDHGPARPVRQGAGDRGSGPETTTPALPHTPSTGREGVKREARGPRTEREERSRSPGTSVPRLARLRSGPGERDSTTSISQSSEPGARKSRRRGAR